MKKVRRHKERIWTLQVLYGLDLKDDFNVEQAKIECENIKERNNLDSDQYYFEKLINGVIDSKDSLDEYINKKAVDWTINRMAIVDRNILRLALYEIENDMVPVGVAIDEAVELAKEYGDEKSPGFINGILSRA